MLKRISKLILLLVGLWPSACSPPPIPGGPPPPPIPDEIVVRGYFEVEWFEEDADKIVSKMILKPFHSQTAPEGSNITGIIIVLEQDIAGGKFWNTPKIHTADISVGSVLEVRQGAAGWKDQAWERFLKEKESFTAIYVSRY